ncbi:hypothetical protein [Nannocystis punicea]|uniref:Uncharacterized protein n=1 Tax=Nannocystis punicea TaxID=2995304 RepID=A0ABY7GZG3_9BACT|nr:hypothetical protein [Nannocystis poenicansa]WAS92396.1 hypothetical protein O0S08_39965 [Nannocystis poenicansa]
MMLTTTFAFASPFVLLQSTAAQPLKAEDPETSWCPGDCDDDEDFAASERDFELDLALCGGVLLGEDHRDCEVRKGPACLAACTFDAVGPACLSEVGDRATPRALAACEADSVAVCRSECDAGGAAFCERGKEVAFVDILACIGVGIDAG